MRIVETKRQRRTEDAGSGGCPPQAVGCTSNPDVHDLTPAQASSLSQSIASASASAASATSTSEVADFGGTTSHAAVDPGMVFGITFIAILVLVFAMAIGYVAFGARGQRCCCRRKRDRVAQKDADASPQIVKQDSEAHLIQKA